MKKYWMVLFAALLLTAGGCGKASAAEEKMPEPPAITENEEPEVHREIAPTNLKWLGVCASDNTIGWEPLEPGEARILGDNESLLFVDGSYVDGACAVRVGRSVLVSVDAAAEAFGKTVSYDGETAILGDKRADCIVMDGVRYLTVEDVGTLFDCRASVYDGGEADSMLPTADLPHVFLSDLPGDGKTAEECREFLQAGLIRAYENAFGAFVPYSEEEGEPEMFDFEANNRHDITNLPVTGENERFVIFEVPAFTRFFYVDRYTDDVFAYYPGYDCFFYLYDFDSPSAMMFAG